MSAALHDREVSKDMAAKLLGGDFEAARQHARAELAAEHARAAS